MNIPNQNEQFIVCETKNGHSSPTRVWVANSHDDYVVKVGATYQHSDVGFVEMSLIETANYDSEASASHIEFFAKNDLENTEGLEHSVLRTAQALGWIESE